MLQTPMLHEWLTEGNEGNKEGMPASKNFGSHPFAGGTTMSLNGMPNQDGFPPAGGL
jgi:hypothetical protein